MADLILKTPCLGHGRLKLCTGMMCVLWQSWVHFSTLECCFKFEDYSKKAKEDIVKEASSGSKKCPHCKENTMDSVLQPPLMEILNNSIFITQEAHRKWGPTHSKGAYLFSHQAGAPWGLPQGQWCLPFKTPVLWDSWWSWDCPWFIYA